MTIQPNKQCISFIYNKEGVYSSSPSQTFLTIILRYPVWNSGQSRPKSTYLAVDSCGKDTLPCVLSTLTGHLPCLLPFSGLLVCFFFIWNTWHFNHFGPTKSAVTTRNTSSGISEYQTCWPSVEPFEQREASTCAGELQALGEYTTR